MLEDVRGDEALRIFMAHLGARGGSRGWVRTGGGGLAATGSGAGAVGGRVGSPSGLGSGGLGVDLERNLTSLRGLEFLRHLAYRFAEFPYENISKIIKVAASPSLEEAMRLPLEVVSDHVEHNFGGTCFSLTFLFERMLKSLGFDCYKAMADMNSGRNVHCLVVVMEGGGRYMVDPGYALYEVIALPGREASGARPHRAESERVVCPHAVVEVRSEGGGVYSLFTEDASGQKWRYRFRDQPTPDGEFERHWLESFGKPTLNSICLNRMTPRGHVYLRKDFFKFTSPTSVEKRRLKQGRERLVEEEFGIGAEWVEFAQKILDERRARTQGRLDAEA